MGLGVTLSQGLFWLTLRFLKRLQSHCPPLVPLFHGWLQRKVRIGPFENIYHIIVTLIHG